MSLLYAYGDAVNVQQHDPHERNKQAVGRRDEKQNARPSIMQGTHSRPWTKMAGLSIDVPPLRLRVRGLAPMLTLTSG